MSNLPTQQRDWMKVTSPQWLSTGNGEKFLYTMGLMSDLLLEKCNQASKLSMPGQTDPSAIPYQAADRVLVQGPAESNANFTLRLQQAWQTWKTAGGRPAVLGQIQAYMQGLQPGVAAVLPEIAIVGGVSGFFATWDTIYQGQAIGAPPVHVSGLSSFSWDGNVVPWRAWLILYMSLVATGQSGGAAATSSLSPSHHIGQNTAGVWVPGGSSGPSAPGPFLNLTGLSGLSSGNVQQWITISGSAYPGNNGTFPIVYVTSPTACTIANPGGTASDAGPLTWSIGAYPYIGPAMPWGGATYGAYTDTFGMGELSTPPTTAATIGGVWQPTTSPTAYTTTRSWGLTCSPLVIQSIRQLLQRWKSAGTYYPNIIVAFDGSTGAAGSAYSPYSAAGSGNPDGTFGNVGKTVAGVVVPTRLISSPYDAYCQGTGYAQGCSQENFT